MFKKVLFSIILSLVMLLATAGAALADDPTTTTVTWDGAGSVGVNVNSGDSNAGFATGGDIINGSYTATDSNNNPYNYGVDNLNSYLNASVTDGFIQTGEARVNSYAPMYGAGGQISYSNVQVWDGTASMAFRSTTNFASMVVASYTYQLLGGHNIVVDAGDYVMDTGISDARGDSGEFYAEGTGTATLDCMSSEASGSWNLAFGRGAGCYTDANFNATGDGYVEVTGVGNDYVKFEGMGIQSGGGQLQFIANWVGSIGIADYSITAH